MVTSSLRSTHSWPEPPPASTRCWVCPLRDGPRKGGERDRLRPHCRPTPGAHKPSVVVYWRLPCPFSFRPRPTRARRECGEVCGPKKARRRDLRAGRAQKGFESREGPAGTKKGMLLSRARGPCFPREVKAGQHSREKNRLYLQVITFRKDPSLALKNLPTTPNPTPVRVWGRRGGGARAVPTEAQGPSLLEESTLLGNCALRGIGAPVDGMLP